jgi:3D (Asp-Asp-Asp) domain-containing protein
MLVTFYGWADNSPPGNAIAYGKSSGYPTVHDAAGGTGSYADPITFASDSAEIAIGTRVYLPFCQKYAVMEDDCVQCDTDWASGMQRHIDVWMNSNGTESAPKLIACEDAWTQQSTVVEVNPPPGRAVAAVPLFTPATNVCSPPPS